MTEDPAKAMLLSRKLGIKAGHRVAVVNAPAGFGATLGVLPEGVEVLDSLDGGANGEQLDLVVWFGVRRDGLEWMIREARAALRPEGGLWISWPKDS
jgi:hypothetical protein